MRTRWQLARVGVVAAIWLTCVVTNARAADRLCDPGGEDCRSILLNLIRNEKVGIDVAFWFMEDQRYTTELIAKWNQGVPIRVLVDTRANEPYPLNGVRIAELAAAGIPIRNAASTYYLHWKMMLFSGQNTVEFSGANYSPTAWHPGTATPYQDYIDEVIYFTDVGSLVNTFRTRFDDAWMHPTHFANLANITGPLMPSYDTFPKDSQLNFPPFESYRSRAITAYRAEKTGIDVIMYRITDRAHADEMIAAVKRGVRVRIITERREYMRLPEHAANIDRMAAAGVKIRERAHAGLNHQKSVILRSQRMAIFGSSNWTQWDARQYQHNMFTKADHIFEWLSDQFERKWFNTGGVIETVALGEPLPAPTHDDQESAGDPDNLLDPPPTAQNGCLTPDPFVALGGGTCYQGNWLPPGMAIPDGGTVTAPPPPSSSTGCATPDPFVVLGGGTCYQGNWLPPGMPIPGTSTPTASAPAPPPSSSTGCATPDPFVVLGGGTCYQGNWLPPGMPIPGTNTLPPPPSASSTTTGCIGPDPFVILGGGRCYQGNWLPPGMPNPGG